MKPIHLGFETPSGTAVSIVPAHIIVAGLTQLSGKTTTLEALITRSELKAIVFKTKPGERGFNAGTIIPPYFKERADWQYVTSLLEATLKEKIKFERSWIMTACKGASSLLEVKRNIEAQLAKPNLGGLNRSVYTVLDEYFNLILPQLSVTSFSKTLELQPGINIMDLQRLKDELQSLVIRSVLEIVLNEMHDTIIVIPEAWKFLPQAGGNPCKQAAENFIRQGATNRNYLWIDSQDMTGVDKTPLKSVSTWIVGLQSEINEVRRTLDQMPISKKLRPKEDEIMSLEKGHFFVCTPKFSTKIYVQPAWMNEETAKNIALGKIKVDDVEKPLTAILPPIPRTDLPVKDEKLLMMEEFPKMLAQHRKETQSLVDSLTQYITRVSEAVQAIGLRPVGASNVDIDHIVGSVIAKLPNAELLKQEIIEAVLKRMPSGGGVGPVIMEPLKALRNTFLEETKTRLLAAINELGPDEKKLIKFLESMQKGCSQKDIVERCFGNKATSGGNNAKIKTMSKELDAKGLARRDDRVSITYPNLRAKIENELKFHQATDQDIDQVYNHILAEMLS